MIRPRRNTSGKEAPALLAGLLTCLLATLGAAQGRSPQTTAEKAFRAASTAQFKALLDLTQARDRALVPDDPAQAARWSKEITRIRAEYIGKLEEILRKHPRDRQIDVVALELGRVLFEEHNHGRARRALNRIRPGRLNRRDALIAARLLVTTGAPLAGAQLVGKLTDKQVPFQQNRLILAAILAAGGRPLPCDTLLQRHWLPVKKRESLAGELQDLEIALTGLAPALARPLQARIYTHLDHRFPGAKELAPRLPLVPGLQLQVGNQAPALAGTDLKGKPIAMAGDGEEGMIIHFWHSGTPAQARELRLLAALNRRWKGKKRPVLGVCLNQSPPMALQWLKGEQIGDLRHLAAPKGYRAAPCQAYGVGITPFTLVLDRKGRIAALGLPAAAAIITLQEEIGTPPGGRKGT